ncbi:hypothetical protein OG607_12250 [Streptomyces sp. NBC_01537]|uniref:hypothetical protein n=1 Tax=Streptomyces sp. NBC_01537 TaxID=2903896 RepID=UPI00386EFACD
MISATNPAGPRRRALLAMPAAAAALLGGCSEPAVRKVGATTRAASPDGAALRATAGRDSVRLLALYDAALAAHPALARLLEPLRDDVARHAQAFGAQEHPVSASPEAPTTAADTVAALASAEKSLADARTTALLDAPPELARLLASVAAAGAAHVTLLKEG